MPEILPKKVLKSSSAKEENILDWNQVLEKFKSSFGNDVFESWIKNITLKKEYNHYVILSAPTRFVRDWIVSRYADKILYLIKVFKKSIQRIEFLIEEGDQKAVRSDFSKNSKVSVIEDSLLNYNRFNSNNKFDHCFCVIPLGIIFITLSYR